MYERLLLCKQTPCFSVAFLSWQARQLKRVKHSPSIYKSTFLASFWYSADNIPLWPERCGEMCKNISLKTLKYFFKTCCSPVLPHSLVILVLRPFASLFLPNILRQPQIIMYINAAACVPACLCDVRGGQEDKKKGRHYKERRWDEVKRNVQTVAKWGGGGDPGLYPCLFGQWVITKMLKGCYRKTLLIVLETVAKQASCYTSLNVLCFYF